MGLPSTLTKPLKSGTKAVVKTTKSGAHAVAHGASAVAKPVAKTVAKPLKPVAKTVAKPLKPLAKQVGLTSHKPKDAAPVTAPPIFERSLPNRHATRKALPTSNVAAQRQKLLRQTFAEPRLRIVRQPSEGSGGKVSFVLAPSTTQSDGSQSNGAAAALKNLPQDQKLLRRDVKSLEDLGEKDIEQFMSSDSEFSLDFNKEEDGAASRKKEHVPALVALATQEAMEGSAVSFENSDGDAGERRDFTVDSDTATQTSSQADLRERLSKQLSDQLQQKLQQQLQLSEKVRITSSEFKDTESQDMSSTGSQSQQKQIISLEVDQEDLRSLKQLSKSGSLRSFTTAGGESFIIEEVLEEEEIIVIEEEVLVDEDDTFPERDFTIRFDEFDEMYDILHLNDYSKHEIKKTWYEREDYNRMVEESRKTAEKMEQATGNDSKALSRKYETRGLENWTEIGSTKAKLIKQAAMDAVWNEQMRQWNNSRANPEQIRVLYARAAKASIDAAKNRGYDDFMIVQKLLEDERLHREKKENMRRPAKLVKKSRRLIGSTVKKTTRTTGNVLKKTGKVAVTGTKIGLKSTKAVATLDAKGLVKAIKNKHKKDDHVEGHRSVRPSRSALGATGMDRRLSNASFASYASSAHSDMALSVTASQEMDKSVETSSSPIGAPGAATPMSLQSNSSAPGHPLSPMESDIPANVTSSTIDSVGGRFTPTKVAQTPESALNGAASPRLNTQSEVGSDGQTSEELTPDSDWERKSANVDNENDKRKGKLGKKAKRELKERERQEKKDREERERQERKEREKREKLERKEEKRQKELAKKNKELEKKYAKRQKHREKKGHLSEWEVTMKNSGKY